MSLTHTLPIDLPPETLAFIERTVVASFNEYQADPASGVPADTILSRIHQRTNTDV
jgi:hypothetical protein